MITSPIIVPLDYPSMEDAMAMARRLDPKLCRVKVGKELFAAAGPQVVERLMHAGFEVFLDLKFHDIPNTVAGACRVAAKQGVWMLNVHASGGRRMLSAAAEAIRASSGSVRPLLIGVTILTSMSEPELAEIGLQPNMADAVQRLAALAQESGLDGVVCSALEAPQLRRTQGAAFKLVTPGIRLANSAKDDQSRVVTPPEAIKMGSDYLVIGRPITGAAEPTVVLQQINDSLKAIHA
jgi:orotidine-5'-phosphate decarboxylase